MLYEVITHYINADVKRQGFLECALDWVSKGNISNYMSKHRYDTDINELNRITSYNVCYTKLLRASFFGLAELFFHLAKPIHGLLTEPFR